MLTHFALVTLGLTLAYILHKYLKLRRNIAIAKTTGLPYVVLPISPVGVFWSVFVTTLIFPVLRRLPFADRCLWINYLNVNHTWTFLRKYSETLGDVFMLVTPDDLPVWSYSAEFNSNISSRRVEFQKPTEVYTVLNHFGRNVLSSEGEDWRRQRKIIAPAFSEKSNAFVWQETLGQAKSMVGYWGKQPGNNPEDMKVGNAYLDLSTLALHIICGAGFGVPQVWPHEDESVLGDRRVAGFNSAKLTGAHKLNFKRALRKTTSIEIIWLNLLPQWILRNSPLQMHKNLIAAYDETRQYFTELFDYKRRVIHLDQNNEFKGTMDLMGPLITASENAGTSVHADKDSNGIPEGVLTNEEIMGNSFIFLFAGHETTAAALSFAMINLAVTRAAQLHLQTDIDSIVGSRPASEWSYSVDMGKLYNSTVGAVLSETLRLTPPAIRVVKVNRRGPETVTYEGKTVNIPYDTIVTIDNIGTHYNPRYFPCSPSEVTDKPDDIEDFVPERWLYNTQDTRDQDSATVTSIDGLENASFERQGSLFRPVKGAYIPFSEGTRGCPGRRFAQVEITAALSVIFKDYSVELDMSKWASDESVARMSPIEKKDVYVKAIMHARKLVRGAVPTIALKVEGEQVALRFVKRGKERFAGLNI